MKVIHGLFIFEKGDHAMPTPNTITPESTSKIHHPESPKQLADRWNVPVSWVYNQTRQRGPNAIPKLKLGKYCRFIPEVVDAWLEARSCSNQQAD
jgi:hypothetical protein